MSDIDIKNYPWTWYWRYDNDTGEANCGITCEPRLGHGYAVVRCPKYFTEQQWKELADYICNLHNRSLKNADVLW